LKILQAASSISSRNFGRKLRRLVEAIAALVNNTVEVREG